MTRPQIDPSSRTSGADTGKERSLSKTRAGAVRTGLILCVLSIAWDFVEGSVAIAAGVLSGSVALIGFGVDSVAEIGSAVVVGWRFAFEMRGRSHEAVERAEHAAARVAGVLLLLLACYIVGDSARIFLGYGARPGPSIVGIVLTALSLVLMPLLGWAKFRTAKRAGSAALRVDSFESLSCAWLAAAALAGLILNAALGWWWADPAAALLVLPIIIREGIRGLKGQDCC